MFGQIRKDLLPMKGHFFFFNAATGPMMSFLPLIAGQLGFSEFLIGQMFMILPISGLIAKPLFGGLADKFKLHKFFFVMFQVILIVAFLTINFIPKVTTQEPSVTTDFKCNNPAFLQLCIPRNYSHQDIISLIDSKNNNSTTSCNLSCSIKSVKTIQTLCDTWGVSNKYCNLNKAVEPAPTEFTEVLDFEARFNQLHLNPENCLEIRVLEAIFANKQVHKTVCPTTTNELLKFPCEIQCPKDPLLNALINNIGKIDDKPKISKWILLWFLGASVVSWVSMAVVVSIGDAICFDLLGNANNRDYGKQRMWGSIAVGTFGIIAGYLTDVISKERTKDFSTIFYIMLFNMIFDIIVSSQLQKNNLNNSNEPSILHELWPLLKENRVLVFAWWCIGAGMCTAVIWNFLFLYISKMPTEHSNWTTLQGLLMVVQSFLGEMPFNFISDTFLKKVGHINSMSFVLLIYAIRFMAYSLIADPWFFIIFELLHGPSVGLCWPTMVSYGDKVAPSGMKATMQGFVGAVFEGIGVAFGSLICGYLMETYKGSIVFRIFSVGALAWLSIFWVLQLILRKMKAYPLQQGHFHMASYVSPDDDAIFMAMSQEMLTY